MPADLTTVGEIARGWIPQVKIFGGTIVGVIAWVIIVVLGILLIFIISILIINKRNYRNTLILFEKINNRWTDTGKDKAMEVKFGQMGSKILYAKKHKKYLPMPQLQSGVRKFYYKIKPDGSWENFELIEEEHPKIAKMTSLEKDMRYATVGILKGLETRYNKPSFLQQYLPMIISFGFITIVGVLTWILFDKWIDLANTTNTGVEIAGRVMERVGNVMGALENICGGKGYVVK